MLSLYCLVAAYLAAWNSDAESSGVSRRDRIHKPKTSIFFHCFLLMCGGARLPARTPPVPVVITDFI